MSLTPRQRVLRAQIAANSRVSAPGYDGQAATRSATDAYWARYHSRVDPDNTLSPEERARRAKSAWQADMARARLAKSKRTRHPRPAR